MSSVILAYLLDIQKYIHKNLATHVPQPRTLAAAQWRHHGRRESSCRQESLSSLLRLIPYPHGQVARVHKLDRTLCVHVCMYACTNARTYATLGDWL